MLHPSPAFWGDAAPLNLGPIARQINRSGVPSSTFILMFDVDMACVFTRAPSRQIVGDMLHMPGPSRASALMSEVALLSHQRAPLVVQPITSPSKPLVSRSQQGR